MTQAGRESGGGAGDGEYSLRAYLEVLRRHPRALLVTFALVACGMAARALFMEPVYTSQAMLQVERPRAGGLLQELSALEGAAPTEAELEIMRSHQVARGAAQSLRPGEMLVEQNAYRPFEQLTRGLFRKWNPCHVELDTTPLRTGPTQTYLFRFRALREDGSVSVAVRRRDEGGDEQTAEVVVRNGQSFVLWERAFTIRFDGDPSQRRYVLPLREPDAFARWIRKRIGVNEVARRTGVVHLAFQAQSPALARRVAEALTESYLSLKREQKRAQARSALQFLETQTEQVRGDLKKAEDALDRYRAETGAVLLSERATWIVEKTSELELQLAEQRVLLGEQKRLAEELRGEENLGKALSVLSAETVDPRTKALAEELGKLELRRDGLAGTGRLEEHPHRKQLETEIASARRQLRQSIETVFARATRRVEDGIRHLEDSIGSYEEEARKLPQTERRITELSRDVHANLQIHKFLVLKQQEAQIALASTLASVRLIDPPLEPVVRSKPNLPFEGLLALAVALAAAIAAAFALEALDRSLKTARALEEATGLPLFGTVPRFATVPDRSLRRYRGDLVCHDRPQSTVAETYRMLRTNLRYAGLEDAIRTVTVISSVPGEGKTLTLCNLAVCCAQAGERVVVVDADLRRPRAHAVFDTPKDRGVVDVLAGRTEWRGVVVSTAVEGVDLLPSGPRTPNPGALLDSPEFRAFLDALSEEYDRVLVDVPPILVVADAAAFLSRLDAALLVHRRGACAEEVVLDARERLRRIGARVLGVVFNGVDAGRQAGGGYGYYGAYGEAYASTEAEPAPRRPEGRNGRPRPAVVEVKVADRSGDLAEDDRS